MAYGYEKEKQHIFTESGLVMFSAIRNNLNRILKESGAITMGLLFRGLGDSWQMMACVDRLVELGELGEVPTKGVGQDRIFMATN